MLTVYDVLTQKGKQLNVFRFVKETFTVYLSIYKPTMKLNHDD